jgi:hypothetical protein
VSISCRSCSVAHVQDEHGLGCCSLTLLGRSAKFVFIPYGDLVFYLLGSGEYDELAGKH